MRVGIAGGHGKIALRLARLLTDRGEEVCSLVRNPDHEADVRDAGAEPILCDLEQVDPGEVVRALEGCEVAVFAAGAGPGSGPERKETMDYGGAVKFIEGAMGAGAWRFLMISSMGADPDAEGDGFAVYLRAKGRADAEVSASGLDFTIVRPGRLTDEPGTGRVELGESVQGGDVPRDDVAAVLAACLYAPETIGRTLGLVAGEVPVDEAVKSV